MQKKVTEITSNANPRLGTWPLDFCLLPKSNQTIWYWATKHGDPCKYSLLSIYFLLHLRINITSHFSHLDEYCKLALSARVLKTVHDWKILLTNDPTWLRTFDSASSDVFVWRNIWSFCLLTSPSTASAFQTWNFLALFSNVHGVCWYELTRAGELAITLLAIICPSPSLRCSSATATHCLCFCAISIDWQNIFRIIVPFEFWISILQRSRPSLLHSSLQIVNLIVLTIS